MAQAHPASVLVTESTRRRQLARQPEFDGELMRVEQIHARERAPERRVLRLVARLLVQRAVVQEDAKVNVVEALEAAPRRPASQLVVDAGRIARLLKASALHVGSPLAQVPLEGRREDVAHHLPSPVRVLFCGPSIRDNHYAGKMHLEQKVLIFGAGE